MITIFEETIPRIVKPCICIIIMNFQQETIYVWIEHLVKHVAASKANNLTCLNMLRIEAVIPNTNNDILYSNLLILLHPRAHDVISSSA